MFCSRWIPSKKDFYTNVSLNIQNPNFSRTQQAQMLTQTLTSDLDGVSVSKRQEDDHPPIQTPKMGALFSGLSWDKHCSGSCSSRDSGGDRWWSLWILGHSGVVGWMALWWV